MGGAVIGAFCAASTFTILFILKKTIGLRVTELEEIEGLDTMNRDLLLIRVVAFIKLNKFYKP